MGTELATIQVVSGTVSSLVNAGAGVLAQLRVNGIARSEARERLRIAVAEARRLEIEGAISRLTASSMADVVRLYELAETRAGLPGYREALSLADQGARLLEQNIQKFVRDVK